MKRLALMLALGLLSAGAFAAVDVDVNIGGHRDGGDMNIGYFYESLAPHGEWVQLKDYGYVWQPSVEVENTNWRPYADEGHWVYTDDGWYWASDYDWGWAPFHYGRWTYDNQYRWVWAPDTTWGPAWVAWREGDRHYGWAPLPIGAVFEPNIGLSFHGRHVDAGFDFGIGANFWTFVPQDRFLSNNIATVAISTRENEAIYRGSRDVSKSYTYNDNRVINNGIPVQSVSRVTKQEVKPLHVESQNAQKPGKSQISGDKITAYKPQIKNEKPANAETLIKEARTRKGENGAAAQPKSNAQPNAGKQNEQPVNTQFERNKAEQEAAKKEELNKTQRPEANKPAERNDVKKPAERNEPNKPAERNEANKPAERNEANKPVERNEANKPAERNEANKPAERNEVIKPAERNEANKPAERNDVKKPEARREETSKPAERNEANKPAERPEANKPAPAVPESKRNINEEARRSEVKQQPPHPEANKAPEPRNNPRADDGHRTDMQSTKNDTELRKEEGKH